MHHGRLCLFQHLLTTSLIVFSLLVVSAKATPGPGSHQIAATGKGSSNGDHITANNVWRRRRLPKADVAIEANNADADDLDTSGLKRRRRRNEFPCAHPLLRNRQVPRIQDGRGGGSARYHIRDDLHLTPARGGQHSRSTVVSLIRILYLTYYASLGSLMPYLPVYYHSLGHSGLYIGLLGAVKPFTTFLVAPLWGIISDKTGKHHAILQYTFTSSLVMQLCMYLRHEVWFLVLCGFLTALLNAPVKSLLDSMVMKSLPAKEKTSYGRLRLWGQLGFGVGSAGVGMLLSRTCGKKGETLPRFLRGYGVAFFLHGLLSIPTLLCMQKFERYNDGNGGSDSKMAQQVKNKKNSSAGWGQIREGLNLLIHNGDAMLFFFLVLVVGISSGLIENFAYVRMREVGGTGKEMGISRLVSSAAGAPMFWFSGPLTSILGADKILVLSILSYVTRFFIYAFMPTALHGLPAEALRGVTFAAFWSTGTIFSHKISPSGMSATMLMFLNAMYGGLGQSLGAIIGGKMQSKLGTVRTFIYSGTFDLCFACIIILYLSVRGDSSFRNPKPISKPSSSSSS